MHTIMKTYTFYKNDVFWNKGVGGFKKKREKTGNKKLWKSCQSFTNKGAPMTTHVENYNKFWSCKLQLRFNKS